MKLADPVDTIPFVGPGYAWRLKKLGVNTVKDLLYHIPNRYQDFSLLSNISTLQPGEEVTIQGQILSIENIYTRKRIVIQRAQVSDGEGVIEATWFNQPFLVKNLPPGTMVSLSGKVKASGSRRSLVSPEYEKLRTTNYAFPKETSLLRTGDTVHTGRLVPIYPETEGLSSKWLRSKISHTLPRVIEEISEYLPEELLARFKLISLQDAIKKVHYPKSLEEALEGRRRLAFDELLEYQLKSLIRKNEWKEKKLSHKLLVNQEKMLQFINSLPFNLTDSQRRSGREILRDLKKSQPMNRLLEGDVGSGKTVVAALACYMAVQNGFQATFMAPTQILASQHYVTLNSILGPLGVSVGLVTGGRRKAKSEKRKKIDVLVGTHALVQKSVTFENLGLVVIDEQHRFGVAQRAILTQKGSGGFSPHVLTMTATPIPRTVALTIYGDLDLSTLDELPKGRLNIKTWVVPPQKREGAYDWIRKHVKDTDEQAFIVCPLIEESEKETMKAVRAATAEFEMLSRKVFPDLRLGLLHGKVGLSEKDEIMRKMQGGEIDILVATPVVEVGIDISNATIMMIEAAERFGLAQLHQLRGRVGRGAKQSYCLLFSGSSSPQVVMRLKSLEKTMSGRELAEIDLKMRGMGELYGTLQHGFPELKIASFMDTELIKATRFAAEWLVEQKADLSRFLSGSEIVVPN
ncbi:MAG: ATP-dependent DNA helicase RecG [Candidatus Blackburnbacteria bacterium]|nr:ATP-dependent DNA helicase RecG [Candidatus Blackburnbacteria bacterium]